MRVLLGFPQADLQTGVFIKNGFQECGAEIVGIHDPKLEDPTELLKLAITTKPDLIFMSRTPSYAIVIKQLRKISLCAFWNVDVRYDIGYWKVLYPLMTGCHFWFTIAKGNIRKYKDAKLGNPYWLSEGIDKIHDKCTPKDMSDVFFAGTIGDVHEGRKTLIRTVAANIQSYNIHNGLGLVNKLHNQAVSNAKICLGHSGWKDVELSMSARDYRIMCAGGFLLTNRVKGIEDYFKGMCDFYDYDVLSKIRYYLDHEDERKEIAEIGYKETHSKHMFKHRMAEVIEIAENYHG